MVATACPPSSAMATAVPWPTTPWPQRHGHTTMAAQRLPSPARILKAIRKKSCMASTSEPMEMDVGDPLQQQIEEVTAEIKAVEQKIVAAEGGGPLLQYWITKEGQLRREKEQLRREKEQMRREKEQMRREKVREKEQMRREKEREKEEQMRREKEEKEQLREKEEQMRREKEREKEQLREKELLLLKSKEMPPSTLQAARSVEVEFEMTEVPVRYNNLYEDEMVISTVRVLTYSSVFEHATEANSSQGYQLLIRSCYMEMWDFALGTNSQEKLILLGNSGIGKSGMLVYLAYRLLQEGKQVLFVFGQDAENRNRLVLRFDLTPARVTGTKVCYTAWQGDTHIFFSQLQDPNAYILVDGVAPSFFCLGYQVLVASPDDSKTGYKEFSKNGKLLYMPPWTEKEILEANAAIYKEEEAVIVGRFIQCGGFPLLVFNDPDRFTPSYLWRGIEAYLASPAMRHEAYHKVVCLRPKDENGSVNYADFVYEYNSQYIRKELYKDEYKQKYEEMKARLMVSAMPFLQPIRGSDAEWLALEHLSQGNTVRYRVPLGVQAKSFGSKFDNESGNVQFNRMLVEVYQEGKPQEEVFYLAKNRNQGAWDAFFMLGGVLYFVQVTVSRRHSKKIVYLETIMKKAGVDKAVIIFEVPPDKFSGFVVQGWHNRRDNPDGREHNEILQVVVEFNFK